MTDLQSLPLASQLAALKALAHPTGDWVGLAHPTVNIHLPPALDLTTCTLPPSVEAQAFSINLMKDTRVQFSDDPRKLGGGEKRGKRPWARAARVGKTKGGTPPIVARLTSEGRRRLYLLSDLAETAKAYGKHL